MKREINRREFFKWSGRIGAGSLGAYLGLRLGTDHEAFVLEVANTFARKRLVDFSAEQGSHRAIFWSHGKDGVGQQELLDTDFVPGRVLVAESGLSNYFAKSDSAVGLARGKVRDREILSGTNTVVFNDFPLVRGPDIASELAPLIVGAGVKLATSREDMSRRTFLRRGLHLASIWLMTGGAKLMLSLTDHFSDSAARELARLNYFVELAHPESLLLTFRNALVAYKTLDLEQDTNILFGKGHWALPFHMQSGRETLLNYLSIYPKDLLLSIAPDPRYLTSSVIVDRSGGGRWQQREIVHPSLQNLFTPTP